MSAHPDVPVAVSFDPELRILVLAPTGRDAALTRITLERAGIASVTCPDLRELCIELGRGAAAILLAEEAIGDPSTDVLLHCIHTQPSWSDLPVLVLSRPRAESSTVARAVELLGNVTVLERPIRIAALVRAVRTAMRARQRQYETRAHLTRIEESERAVREKAEELGEMHRRKDEFLAILAHELRNPLAPIRNSLHVLRLTRPHDPTAERVGEMMERQVNHMVRLVDDLLEVSRITRGKIDLRKEPVQVESLIRSAVETSQPLIESAGHRLVLDLPAEPLTVEADPVRLAQVFSNLLNNAAKYTDPSGEIRIAVTREGDDGVRIAVLDTGMGISPEMLPRVFELFTQAQRDTQGGLGIGLTLVKRLVEMHGGSVQAESEGPGRGSEFSVRLPLLAEQPAEAPHARPQQTVGPQRVLVVDDNRDAAESLGMVLKLLGADVHVVYNGPDALQAVSTYRPSAVLLDIGMPGMDGEEVARRMRQRPDCEDVTLVALTGWGQDDDRRRTLAAGFDHHLIKPADLHALTALLASIGSTPEGSRGSA